MKIHQLLVDVLTKARNFDWTDEVTADALIEPLAEIFDFAADFCDEMTEEEIPEMHALLTDWRTERMTTALAQQYKGLKSQRS